MATKAQIITAIQDFIALADAEPAGSELRGRYTAVAKQLGQCILARAYHVIAESKALGGTTFRETQLAEVDSLLDQSAGAAAALKESLITEAGDRAQVVVAQMMAEVAVTVYEGVID